MKVPLLDLKAQYASIRDEIEQAIRPIIENQSFILGPAVRACEEAVASYCRCAHAIGVSSGTDALLVCLMAEGIGWGDEVITTPYTFFATAGSIARTGARPVFVDIDPVTFNLDTRQLEEHVTPRTRAIMPVHLYGQMADMDTIMRVAGKHHLLVIEDAAQAIGAEHRGSRAGATGHYGCFSFFPSKNLGGFGDGGMVVTQDAARAEKIAIFRNHGAHPKYVHHWIGGNFRLDALQAAVITVKLRHLDAWTARRRANAERYRRLFEQSGLSSEGLVRLPECTTDRHIYNQYVIRASRRDDLRKYLEQQGIGTEVYYPIPLHLQECFAHLGYRQGDFPESERATCETLALPIYPELSNEQAEYVVDRIKQFFTGHDYR